MSFDEAQLRSQQNSKLVGFLAQGTQQQLNNRHESELFEKNGRFSISPSPAPPPDEGSH